jgi:hypothetical protein
MAFASKNYNNENADVTQAIREDDDAAQRGCEKFEDFSQQSSRRRQRLKILNLPDAIQFPPDAR